MTHESGLTPSERFVADLCHRSFLRLWTHPARVAVGHGGTAFVFMLREGVDRDFKTRELALRCQIVRARCPGITKVVGIGIDPPGVSAIGYSSDIAFLDFPEFTDEQRAVAFEIQEDLGYFKGVVWGGG